MLSREDGERSTGRLAVGGQTLVSLEHRQRMTGARVEAPVDGTAEIAEVAEPRLRAGDPFIGGLVKGVQVVEAQVDDPTVDMKHRDAGTHWDRDLDASLRVGDTPRDLLVIELDHIGRVVHRRAVRQQQSQPQYLGGPPNLKVVQRAGATGNRGGVVVREHDLITGVKHVGAPPLPPQGLVGGVIPKRPGVLKAVIASDLGQTLALCNRVRPRH